VASTGTLFYASTIRGGISNNAGTVALFGSPTVTDVFNSGGWGGGTPTITANNTNKSLDIAVTGVAATNITWLAKVTIVMLARLP
jgi:hypothetical protein